jgi:FkbM family methyltransferase
MFKTAKQFRNFFINFPILFLTEKSYVRFVMFISRVYGIIYKPYLTNYASFYQKNKIDFELHQVKFGNSEIVFQSGYRINRFVKGLDGAGKGLWDRYHIDKLIGDSRPAAILDVGSNIGEFALYADKKFNGQVKIIAIEPDLVAVACLEHNLKQTGITIENVAVSEKVGTQQFFLKTTSADSSLHNPKGDSISVEVVVKRIDQIIKEQYLVGPILIKMDTEGYEPEALVGAIDAIKEIKWISVDTGPERSGERTTSQVSKILTDYGFDKIHVYKSDILTAYKSSDE